MAALLLAAYAVVAYVLWLVMMRRMAQEVRAGLVRGQEEKWIYVLAIAIVALIWPFSLAWDIKKKEASAT